MANKRQNQIAISENERCFATLIASGLWNQAQAHRISFPESKLKDDSQRRQMASNLNQKPQVIAYKRTALLSFVAEQNKAAVSRVQDNSTLERVGNRDKESIRTEMNLNVDRETDPVKKNKLLLELASLDALRGNDDDGNKDERVLYYIPLICSKCSIYKEKQDEKAKQK